MNALPYTMALLMGFTGSLHCAGMCGPIVWIMPFQAFKGTKKIVALGLYHASRISVYAFFALVLHSFRNLFDPKVQQYISIALGGSLLVIGLLSFVPNHIAKLKLPWAEYVKKKLGHMIGRPRIKHPCYCRNVEWPASMRPCVYGAVCLAGRHFCFAGYSNDVRFRDWNTTYVDWNNIVKNQAGFLTHRSHQKACTCSGVFIRMPAYIARYEPWDTIP